MFYVQLVVCFILKSQHLTLILLGSLVLIQIHVTEKPLFVKGNALFVRSNITSVPYYCPCFCRSSVKSFHRKNWPYEFLIPLLSKAFGTPAKITSAVKNKEVEGVLIDNYALTRFSNSMEDEPIRLERTIEHPITYGLVLPTGSPRTAQCVRRYMDNYNHEIFEHIAKHLKPVKVKYQCNE